MMKIYIQQKYIADKTRKCRIKSNGEIVILSNPAKLSFLTKILKQLKFLFYHFKFSFLYIFFFSHKVISTLFGPNSLWILQKFLCHLLHQILFSGN